MNLLLLILVLQKIVTLNIPSISLNGNTVVDGNNTILKNVPIPIPFNYLSNFWRSLDKPLVNCKVKLKLRWMKRYVLPWFGAENNKTDYNIIIFNTKVTKLYVPIVTLSARGNKKLSKLLTKGLKNTVFEWI